MSFSVSCVKKSCDNASARKSLQSLHSFTPFSRNKSLAYVKGRRGGIKRTRERISEYYQREYPIENILNTPQLKSSRLYWHHVACSCLLLYMRTSSCPPAESLCTQILNLAQKYKSESTQIQKLKT